MTFSRPVSTLLIIVVASIPGLLAAGVVGPLVTFTNGTVADATTVNANFATLKTAVDSNGAVGDVVSSLLTEAQFQAARGTGWVLADGRSVAGSAYATTSGQTSVPDLRGVYLRGKNNGRADGKQNPDGEVALGTYQADTFASHNHVDGFAGVNTTASFGVTTTAAAGNINSQSGTNTNFHAITSSTGGNETRTRNVTVNYFVRIN